ncbi:MAG: tail fiber domain-containing protein [Bacteroidia bacterium]|nr:tail fiber domain-containing protein [Bacteroidia bacterium]
MKKNIALLFILFSMSAFSQNVGINSTGATPNASAMLDVDVSSLAANAKKGLLIPRVALASRIDVSTIPSPATSLLVYNTFTSAVATASDNVTPGFYYYDGAKWNAFSANDGKDWSLLGNASTVDGTNFIGTTDNIPFNIRVNNQRAGRIASDGATFFGYQAGNANGALVSNTAFGFQSLLVNTGESNTGIGYKALGANTSGDFNTAVGDSALLLNTNGSYNTSVGTQALTKNTSGAFNTATGTSALYSAATASYNAAFGAGALYSATAGNNSGFGAYALYYNTSGTNNTAAGVFSLLSNTVGANNAGFGANTLYSTTGGSNTAVGAHAMYSNTTGTNTAVGAYALYTNTTGNHNTAVGLAALRLNTGSRNTALGSTALQTNAGGTDNTASGYRALASCSTGSYNVAFGSTSMQNNATSSYNTAMGYGALPAAITGGSNTAVGYFSLLSTTGAGSFNTAVGVLSGTVITTGTNNTFIGATANASANNLTNASAIGFGTSVTASNNMVFGNTSVVGWGFGVAPGAAAIRVGTGGTNGNGATLTVGGVWTDASDSTKKYNIMPISYGLKDVLKLRPVSYKMKGTGYQDFGFIAQEVKLIFPEVVYGKEGQMTMSYGQLTSVLTKAIQEQQTIIDEQKQRIDKLEALLKELALKVK